MEMNRLVRRLKLRDLNMFSVVAKRGSMAKASTELGLTQPAVSKAVADMETALGVPLFDRTPQGVALTPYGNVLLNRARAVLDELQQTAQELEFLADPTVGRVRLGTTDIMLYGFVPDMLDRMTRKYPRMQFDVIRSTTAELLQKLRERSIDLMLGRIELAPAKDLRTEFLFEDALVIAAGPKSRWAGKRRLRLADLVDQPWVMPDSSMALVWPLFAEAFTKQGLPLPPSTITCASIPLQVSMVMTGRFLTFLPASVLRSPSQRIPLRPVAVKLEVKPPPVGIATLKHRTPSAPTALLIKEASAMAQAR